MTILSPSVAMRRSFAVLMRLLKGWTFRPGPRGLQAIGRWVASSSVARWDEAPDVIGWPLPARGRDARKIAQTFGARGMLRRMRRLLALTLLTSIAAACGGGAPRAPGAPEPTLVDGEAIYPVRFNPPPCLTEGPELRVEVRTPAGWERVALEDADEDQPLMQTLLDDFAAAPDTVRSVRANLTSTLRPYGGQHVARVLRLIELDPPPAPPDETTAAR